MRNVQWRHRFTDSALYRENPKTLVSFTVIEDQQRMQPTARNQLQQEKSRSFSLFL